LARVGIRKGVKTFYTAVPHDAEAAAEPDWIWLPNSLIDGVGDETPPIERIRQTQNALMVRLLIDLYHAQNLADDGGINWRPRAGIRRSYERLRVAESREHVVWGFKRGTLGTWNGSPLFDRFLPKAVNEGDDPNALVWAAWHGLEKLGLVEFVAHLVESDTAEGELICPLAHSNGEEIERTLMQRAFTASQALATEGQMAWAMEKGATIFSPALAHMTEVQCVGIARLRYRPKTRATAAWAARHSDWKALVERFDEVASQAEARRVATSR
jgi:hypothetical protein